MKLARVFYFVPQFKGLTQFSDEPMEVYKSIKTLYPVIHRIAEPKPPSKRIFPKLRPKPTSGAYKKPKPKEGPIKTACGAYKNLEVYDGEPTPDPIAGITLCGKCFPQIKD